MLETPVEPEGRPEIQRPTASESTRGTSSNLKRIEVPFRAFEGSARRIIIPVTFNDSVTANLLLDTGAPGLTISPKLADRLGLINEQDGNLRIMTGGIGGTVPAMLAVVDAVSVGEAHAEFLPAVITEIPSEEFEGLVGMDFMANYRISIDNEKNVLAFDELPPQIERPGGHDEIWWRSNFREFSRLKDEWKEYQKEIATANLASSEADRIVKIVKTQSSEADRIYRKLESYAREKAVPVTWRR
ncbi:MAG TPA: retropepsin-like aspartic protease [Acidobacteriota bacterium]|nr:retropepsin-like aspartic protease [Acidobacteriota bacterium]